MRYIGFTVVSMVCMLMALVAQAARTDVAVSDAYIFAPIPGRAMSVAYWQLHNLTDQPKTLLGVSLPEGEAWASGAEIHQHLHRDGMMRMQKVESLTLVAKGQQVFESGGYHVMVFGVTALEVGQSVPLLLHWQDGSKQPVMLDVRRR